MERIEEMVGIDFGYWFSGEGDAVQTTEAD